MPAITKYAWDETDSIVKVYVEHVGHKDSDVKVEFQPKGFDLKIADLQLLLPELKDEIVPEECKFVVKESKVVLTLKKKKAGKWWDLKKPAPYRKPDD